MGLSPIINFEIYTLSTVSTTSVLPTLRLKLFATSDTRNTEHEFKLGCTFLDFLKILQSELDMHCYREPLAASMDRQGGRIIRIYASAPFTENLNISEDETLHRIQNDWINHWTVSVIFEFFPTCDKVLERNTNKF